MDDIKISADAMVEGAFRIVIGSACKTEKDKAVFETICQSCDKNGISVQKYLAVVSEVAQKMNEWEECE